mmetsp:Transcript_21159/g.67610  ORF Transcript_21159/g.67610 Transcript_21159/m.67610 type:complete len:313 (+) Transcript_21159:2051-2989(+)
MTTRCARRRTAAASGQPRCRVAWYSASPPSTAQMRRRALRLTRSAAVPCWTPDLICPTRTLSARSSDSPLLCRVSRASCGSADRRRSCGRARRSSFSRRGDDTTSRLRPKRRRRRGSSEGGRGATPPTRRPPPKKAAAAVRTAAPDPAGLTAWPAAALAAAAAAATTLRSVMRHCSTHRRLWQASLAATAAISQLQSTLGSLRRGAPRTVPKWVSSTRSWRSCACPSSPPIRTRKPLGSIGSSYARCGTPCSAACSRTRRHRSAAPSRSCTRRHRARRPAACSSPPSPWRRSTRGSSTHSAARSPQRSRCAM